MARLPGGPRRVRAAAQPAHRGVEGGDARRRARPARWRAPCRGCRAGGARWSPGGPADERSPHDLAGLVGRAHADGVAERDLPAAERRGAARRSRRRGAGRPAPRTGSPRRWRRSRARAGPAASAGADDLVEGPEGLVDGLVHVLLVVGLRRGEEDRRVDRRPPGGPCRAPRGAARAPCRSGRAPRTGRRDAQAAAPPARPSRPAPGSTSGRRSWWPRCA